MAEHESFLCKFTREFKKQDMDCNGVLDEQQFRQLLINMHSICEANGVGLFAFDQNVENEIDSLLGAIDPQNNQHITYSEIVQLLSQRTVPYYPGGEYNLNVINQEPKQVPILEKFVKFAPDADNYFYPDDQSNQIQAPIGAQYASEPQAERRGLDKEIAEMDEESSI